MIKEDWLWDRAQTLKGKAENGWSRTSSWHKGGSPSPVKADNTLTSSSWVGARLDHFLWLWWELNCVSLCPALALLNRGRRMKGKGGKNTLYLENHYRTRELLQGANKILNYSSSIQLILDPLKEEKNTSQCNRNYHHRLTCRYAMIYTVCYRRESGKIIQV